MNNLLHTIRAYRAIAVSLAILIAAILGLFVGIVPLVRTSLAAGAQLGPLTEEVQVLTEKIGALGSIDEAQLSDSLGLLVSAVPSERSIPSLFATVEGMAAESGVSVGDLVVLTGGSLATASAARQTAQERQIGTNLLSFSMSIEGTIEQIRAFLALSGTTRRVTRVKTFSLNARSGGLLRTTLEMDAFWAPYPAVIGKVSQRIVAISPSQEDVIARLSAMREFSSVAQLSTAADIPAGPVKPDPFSP